MIKPHSDDVVCEQLIGEWSFELVNKGVYERNDVAVKKTKEVNGSVDALAEFTKEVAVLDKFWCDQVVHFYGACIIRNHIMKETKRASCSSLGDDIKRWEVPDKSVNEGDV